MELCHGLELVLPPLCPLGLKERYQNHALRIIYVQRFQRVILAISLYAMTIGRTFMTMTIPNLARICIGNGM